MTCLEKYIREHPGEIVDHIVTMFCPQYSGGIDIDEPEYCNSKYDRLNCVRCWEREVPSTEVEQETTITTAEKRQALDDLCCQHNCNDTDCPLAVPGHKCGNGFTFLTKSGKAGYMTDEEITAAYDVAFPKSDPKPTEPKPTDTTGTTETVTTDSTPVIKDSGERREFPTGAVRDIQEGKGRCDLMPLRVAATVIDGDPILDYIGLFQDTGDTQYLYLALQIAARMFDGLADMLLEVSKHFEEGAKKYGENNWQKGLPINCYIDSAVRHYLKWLRGDKDEPHDRAFVWNLMCCIWTCDFKPELNKNEQEDWPHES